MMDHPCLLRRKSQNYSLQILYSHGIALLAFQSVFHDMLVH